MARMCRRAARHGSTMKTRDRSRRREEQRRRMAAAHSVGMQSVADSGWTQGPQRRNGWNAGGRKDHAPPNGQPPLLRTNSSTSGWRSYDRALRPKRPQPTAEFRGLEDRCRATSMTLMGRLPHYLSLGCCGERRIDRTLCVRRCSWARGALEHRVVGYHQDGCTTLHEGAADCPRREWVGCRLPGDRITVSVLVARMRVQSLTPTKLPASVWRSRRHTKSHQRVHESARTTQDDSPTAAPRWRRSQPLARRQCNLRSMPAHSWNTWEGRGPASIQSYRKSRENLWI